MTRKIQRIEISLEVPLEITLVHSQDCNEEPPSPLVECPVCGACGVKERIATDHDCVGFLQRQGLLTIRAIPPQLNYDHDPGVKDE